MRLLVSVESPSEAVEALAGGADIVDAKNPRIGALGMVNQETFLAITRVCGARVPVSAALGDEDLTTQMESRATEYAAAGAGFVKMGFARRQSVADVTRTLRRLAARVHGSGGRCGVVAVAYADASTTGATALDVVLEAAVSSRVAGVLIDTADKSGPGLRALRDATELQALVAAVRAAGQFVAMAGRLSIDDVAWCAELGADVVGVRGAACEAGRLGCVSAARVQTLRARCATRHPL